MAGGRSSRFGGFPKGTLKRPDGQRVVDHLLRIMAEAGVPQRVIVANDPQTYSDQVCPVIPDLRPGMGPLGGIEAALTHFRESHDAVFFLPCDLPGLGTAQLKAVLQTYRQTGERLVVAETGLSRMEPLCSVVDVKLLDEIALSVSKGSLSVNALWRQLAAHAVRFEDPAPFCNVNREEDWNAWRRDKTGA